MGGCVWMKVQTKWKRWTKETSFIPSICQDKQETKRKNYGSRAGQWHPHISRFPSLCQCVWKAVAGSLAQVWSLGLTLCESLQPTFHHWTAGHPALGIRQRRRKRERQTSSKAEPCLMLKFSSFIFICLSALLFPDPDEHKMIRMHTGVGEYKKAQKNWNRKQNSKQKKENRTEQSE